MSRRARVPSLYLVFVLLCVAGWHAPSAQCAEEPAIPDVSFVVGDGTLVLNVGTDVVGTYVFNEPVITRPHFRNLHAPGGALVTRVQPPVEGRDATDHADMHPGAWLAFGDIGGADVWRNKAKVEHVRFVEPPSGGEARGSFAVENRYGDGRGGVVCSEVCRYTLLARPAGYLLVADSTFHAGDRDLTFGDQEEMGFGVRLATGVTVKAGGRIVDSEGRENEPGIWGKSAAWVDYSGTLDRGRVGVMLVPDPANPHPSRFHVRDYGLMVANPFGRAAFGDKDGKPVVVPAGQDYRMRFAVLIHASQAGAETDLEAAYQDCRHIFGEKP